MKYKDLSKQFEDVGNDWLSQQIRLENNTFSFDSSQKELVKALHQENCDMQHEKEIHQQFCANNNISKKPFDLKSFILPIGVIVFCLLEVVQAITNINFIGIGATIGIIICVLVKSIRRK